MTNTFLELPRVQIPAMVHLTRLGYEYLKTPTEVTNIVYDPKTNILVDVFKSQFKKLNPNSKTNVDDILDDIRSELNQDDLGRSFYKRLVNNKENNRLIDFEHTNNNIFQFTYEFSCKNEGQTFRPDITLFINGLPLVFIEVKQPNNKDGMIAEYERLNNDRFPNQKFRRFLNITQFMIFSNNMEYDTMGGVAPISGSFYSTISKDKAFFNVFKEECPIGETISPFIRDFPYIKINNNIENKILSDTGFASILNTNEYRTNLDINTPCNRILTSMCSKQRILFLLKYGIVYVDKMSKEDFAEATHLEKHIMRYQQFFASKAVVSQILSGNNSGIVWHTQGSGKTALAYFLSRILKDELAKKGIITKFYFIVDRLDLLEQAEEEFSARGLFPVPIDTKVALMNTFENSISSEGSSGKDEIIVTNIQKFKDKGDDIEKNYYSTNLQRIFFVDEAHRGYNPKGSFLANLFDADKNSIKIALTGTPLIAAERKEWQTTCNVFGNYYHKYYYDKSIEDGYTVKLLREPIETTYKEKLSSIYNDLEKAALEKLIEKKDINRLLIVENIKYVKELLRYIIDDFRLFTQKCYSNIDGLGAMIVCESATQAVEIYKNFNKIQDELNSLHTDRDDDTNFKAEIILDPSSKYNGDKNMIHNLEERKAIIKNFKYEKDPSKRYDFLIVFQMLQTGFDAPRLKKMYLGKKLQGHNLLQALTRVNRPFKGMKYGYVVDFADIKENFDIANKNYLDEINKFEDSTIMDVPSATFSHVMEDGATLLNVVNDSLDVLFEYDTSNAELFSTQVSNINDKDELYKIRTALVNIKDRYNYARNCGDNELLKKIRQTNINKFPSLITAVERRILILNKKEAIEKGELPSIDFLIDAIEFSFKKGVQEELVLTGESNDLNESLSKCIHSLNDIEDKSDSEFITLKDAFLYLLKNNDILTSEEMTTEEYRKNVKFLKELSNKIEKLQNENDNIKSKYDNDSKYLRIHKYIVALNKNRTVPFISSSLTVVQSVLMSIKKEIDKNLYMKSDIANHDNQFSQMINSILSNILNNEGLRMNRGDKDDLVIKLKDEYYKSSEDKY